MRGEFLFRFIPGLRFTPDHPAQIGFPALNHAARRRGLIQQEAFDLYLQMRLFPHFTLDTRGFVFARFDSTSWNEPVAATAGMFPLLDQQDLVIAQDGALIPDDTT